MTRSLLKLFACGLALILVPKICALSQERIPTSSTQPAWSRIETYFRMPEGREASSETYRSPLVDGSGNKMTDATQWPARRKQLLDTWNTYLGEWPSVITQPHVELLDQQMREGILMKHVRVEIAQSQTGDAWLLVPPGNRPKPAVLVVFYDPETSVGLKGDKPDRDFGWQLAKRGFVTLNIGTPGGNAYKPDIGSARCQPLSFHAYVAANCWHVLAAQAEVDASRIGIVGHSYGGKWAMFAGAMWDKFAAVAVSDPGIVFDETRSSINYWEPWYLGLDDQITRKPGVPTADNPTTGAYRKLREAGHDLHEIQAMICPRPFFVSGGSEDPPKRWQALSHSIEINRLLGVESRVGMTNRPDHSPNNESNAVLYDFFTHFLIEQFSR